MKLLIATLALLCVQSAISAEIRLLDLDPSDAQQYIDKQDTTLKYAPKIESSVPALRYLGNEQHHVVEDIYLANQYHGQDGLGGYLYGYAVPDIAKTERKQAGGDLRGAYNYIAGNGQEIKVQYWDDGTGFHQIDNLPKGGPEDLPQVKAAKEEFLRIWQQEAERNSKPVANPYDDHGHYAAGPLSLKGQEERRQQLAQWQRDHPQVQQYQQPQVQQYQYRQPQPQQIPQFQPQPHQVPVQIQVQQYQPQPQQSQQVQVQQKPPQQNQPQPQPKPQPQPQQPNQLINQYQQQKQQFPNPGQQTVQYQGDQSAQYQPQQTQTVNKYQAKPQEGNDNDDGEYRETDEGQYKGEGEEEPQGPPKGFFYSFDYPVGIIVGKDGQPIQQQGDVKDVYASNKATYEQQLQDQHSSSRPTRSSSGYLYIKN